MATFTMKVVTLDGKIFESDPMTEEQEGDMMKAVHNYDPEGAVYVPVNDVVVVIPKTNVSYLEFRPKNQNHKD